MTAIADVTAGGITINKEERRRVPARGAFPFVGASYEIVQSLSSARLFRGVACTGASLGHDNCRHPQRHGADRAFARSVPFGEPSGRARAAD